MKLELVDDWHLAWRWASVRLATLAGLLASAMIAGWPVVQWAVNELLPAGPLRVAFAIVGGLVVMGGPIASRLLKKKDC